LQLLGNVECVLGIELLAACQGIELLHEQGLTSTAPLEHVFRTVREKVPFYDKDRFLKPDIDAALSFVRDGTLWAVAKPYLVQMGVDTH